MNVLVSVLVLCCCARCALSKDELSDFIDFLEKTSVLDQKLKVSGEVGVIFDSPEDDVISEHAWEESGKFEGDLLLNDRQRRLVAANVVEGLSRNGLRDVTKRWPDNEVVYYIQREHFSGSQVQAIHDGIEDLARATCVTFRPYKKGDRDAVVIQGNRNGCFSQVGYQGGYQVLNLSRRHPAGRGCFRHGTVVHELLHTLGFFHMQSSPDRDDYIDVMWENIIEPSKHNFRKYNTFTVSDFGVGYDYDSVMHYSARAFSSNGRPTIVPKQRGVQIGQRIGLSDKDLEKLKKMYCDADNSADSAAASNPGPGSTAAADARKHAGGPAQDKKRALNQPFQGHGIGYHQGKTVVIKLPAAKTYNLPIRPSIRTFDYFSKTPKALLPKFVQRFGIGKEIKQERPSSFSYTKKLEDAEAMFDNDIKKANIEPEMPTPDYNLSPASSREVIDKQNHKELLPSDLPSDLTEAFRRLGEIIKSHVYPSQKPSFENSKGETDFSQFFNPKFKEMLMKTGTLDKKKVENAEKSKEKIKTNVDKTQNKTNGDISSTNYPDFDYVSKHGETDESYGTTSSFKELMRHKEHKFSYSPDFGHNFNYDYKDKHDFSDLYDGKHPKEKKIGEPYKLFGEVVPPAEKNIEVSESPEVDQLAKVHKPFTEHSYSVEHEDSDSSEKSSMDKNSESDEEPPSKSHTPHYKTSKTGPWFNVNKTRASIFYGTSDDSEEQDTPRKPYKVSTMTKSNHYPKYEKTPLKNYRKTDDSESTNKKKPSGPVMTVHESRGSIYHEDVSDESEEAAEYPYKHDSSEAPIFPTPAYFTEHKSFGSLMTINPEVHSVEHSEDDTGYDDSSDYKMPKRTMLTENDHSAILSPFISSETDLTNSKGENKERQGFIKPTKVKDGDYSNEYEGSFDKRLSEILKGYEYIDDTTENYTTYKKSPPIVY